MQCSPRPELLAVYLVEDSPAIRARYTTELAEMPHIRLCGSAVNAREAIDGILSEQPDVVILDLGLEDSSGLEVLTALQTQPQRPEVAVVSVDSDPITRARCRQLGANRFYDKSNGFLQLLDYLESLAYASR